MNTESFSEDFFSQRAEIVAPLLLGAELKRFFPDGRFIRTKIVETEAYGVDDPACHAYRRKTERNKSMFLPGGHFYVYKIYGIHICINIVTGRENESEAVLIRALEIMESSPDIKNTLRVASGPGKLCKFLEIDRNFDGLSLFRNGLLEVYPGQTKLGEEKIVQTTRIGITKGIEIPWRWYISESRCVSKK